MELSASKMPGKDTSKSKDFRFVTLTTLSRAKPPPIAPEIGNHFLDFARSASIGYEKNEACFQRKSPRRRDGLRGREKQRAPISRNIKSYPARSGPDALPLNHDGLPRLL